MDGVGLATRVKQSLLSCVTILAIQTVMTIVALLVIKTVMAIVTVLAMETGIHLSGIEPGIKCKELVLG